MGPSGASPLGNPAAPKRRENYFWGGGGMVTGFPGEPGIDGVTVMGAGPFAGGFAPAGSDCFAGADRSSTVALAPALRVARMESESDVHINRTAEIVVALVTSVAHPHAPTPLCDPL